MIDMTPVFVSFTPLRRMGSVHFDFQTRDLQEMPIAGDDNSVIAKRD